MCRLCASVSVTATMPIFGQGARQLPASREETFKASFEVGTRTPGPVRRSTRRGRREHQRRLQVVVVGEVNSLSDTPRRRPSRGRRVPVQGVLLLVALLPRRRPDDEDREQLLLVDGATRLTGPNSHPLHEEAVEVGAHGEEGELPEGDASGTANRETSPTLLAQADVREGP